ncbi:purine-cytosine permease fcy22, partial [Colletotrichum incanum]
MPARQPLGDISPNTRTLPAKKPRGKKPKPITQRKYTAAPPIKRPEQSYSQQKKVAVVMFLEHERYPIEAGPATRQRAGDTRLDPTNGLRRPTYSEATAHFKIPRTTIIDWYKQRETIVNSTAQKGRPNWPELEANLYDLFRQLRDKSAIVTTGWFRRTSKALFRKAHDSNNNPLAVSSPATTFRFSVGWFALFRCRWNISHRRLTKQATKLPADYLRIVTNFLHFNRRVSQPALARQPVGGLRFPLDRILNFDETP